MAGVDRLLAHLPASYDVSEGSNNRTWFLVLGEALDFLQDWIDVFKNNRFLESAEGPGLNRAAENYSITRPPGLSDTYFRSLAQKIASGRRCTIFAIKSIFEAASGFEGVTVEDYQVYTGARPALFEIRITIPTEQASSLGRGYFPGFSPTYEDGFPVESGLVGDISVEQDHYGGLFNDHYWSIVDAWPLAIMDKIRAAGTFYTFGTSGEYSESESLSDFTGRIVKVLGGPYDIEEPYRIILVDSSVAAITVNLPLAASSEGLVYTFKDCGMNASINNITIGRQGGETIDGTASDLLITTNGGAVSLYAHSGNWFIEEDF